MPAPGFQHQTVSNPFEEPKLRISEYTADEIMLLQHQLEKKLGPEYISARPGPSGQPVHYIAAEKVISLANDVFGFNGWSSSIQNLQVDFADEHPTTHRITLGISVVVRVTLRDGTFHEDIGYGQIENAKTKGAAFEKAKKEATTDAMKRALRHFGNVLGNCIYDKDYVKKVTKIKIGPGKQWELADLHRHGDFKEGLSAGVVPVQQQQQQQQQPQQLQQPPQQQQQQQGRTASVAPPTTGGGLMMAPAQNETMKLEKSETQQPAADAFDDFLGSMDDFDEADFNVPGEHPDGVVISTGSTDRPPVTTANPQPNPPPHGNMNRALETPTTLPPQPPNQFSRPNGHVPPNRPPTNQPPCLGAPPGGVPEQISFLSARGVKQISDLSVSVERVAFNPRAESPSIRKTAGIDHNSSKPVARNGAHVPPQQTTSTPNSGGAAGSGGAGGFAPPGMGFNNAMDGVRRIGAPGGGVSPLANRGQYRPPTMKRPLPSDATGNGVAGRAALTEVFTNGSGGTGGDGGGGGGNAAGALDPKRQKVA